MNIKCPSCNTDLTDRTPLSCASHLHPQMVQAIDSIRSQYSHKTKFARHSLVKPPMAPNKEPVLLRGEEAIFERLHQEWWDDVGKLTYDACFPDR